jgi:hypothetical protein
LNIRLSSKDLEAIQKRALAEGLPYQTLISSLLHKYASGPQKRSEETRSQVAHWKSATNFDFLTDPTDDRATCLRLAP